jgi:TolB-like protein
MATGRRPFTGETSVSVLSSILKDTPPSITDLKATLPRELGRIVRRALTKDVERRYQTAKDLRNELEDLKREIESGPVPPAVAARTAERVASIAVMPFTDMSAAKDQDWFCDGIAEEIINSLTSVRDLRVIGRTSSFQFKGEKLDLRDIGKKLNVATILEGSIQQSGNKMRIIAQLIRTNDNSHIWAERYDIEQTDFFKIQDNIAASIVENLSLTLSSFEQSRLIKKSTSEEAYMLYLKGLFQFKRNNWQPAADIFQQVVTIDSLYAPAIAHLALSKAWIIIGNGDFTNILKTDEKLKKTASKARAG